MKKCKKSTTHKEQSLKSYIFKKKVCTGTASDSFIKPFFSAELIKSSQENSLLNDQIIKLKNALDDCKSQLVVDSITLESNFEVEKRKAEEEIATLQRLINGMKNL